MNSTISTVWKGAATIVPLSPPSRGADVVIGIPLSIAVVAASSSFSQEGGGDPALAIGTRRPCSSWNTTQRSASVASRVAWATASSTRAMTPDEASACPTLKSRSRSRAHRRAASVRAIFERSSSRTKGLVR